MTDFEKVARAELASVEAELSRLDIFKKYQRLRDIVALYAKDRSEGAADEPAPPSRFERSIEPKRIKRGVNPQRDHALKLAEEAIKGRYAPTKTSEIYDVIVANGAEIGGREPKGNLSAMLHHSPLFRSHGRQGWTLKEYDAVVDILGEAGAPTDSAHSDQGSISEGEDEMHGL